MMANKKKDIKVSKNRKKYWRKCDINDIELYLEDKRFDERIGGAVSDKTDETLFIIDKRAVNEDTREANEKTDRKCAPKHKLNDIKSNLKYLRSLEPQSKVPPMRARSAPKDRKKTYFNDDKKFWKFWPQKQVFYEKTERERNEKQMLRTDPKLRFNVYDIWGEEVKDNEIDSDMSELIDIQSQLKGSKAPKKSQYLYQKPSLLPAIEIPDSGASYNPSLAEHQKLILKAHSVEVDKLKIESKLKRQVDANFVTKAEARSDKNWIKEMSAGLGLSDDESEPIDGQNQINCESDILDLPSNRVRREKKTKAKRRKELMIKNLNAIKQKEKMLKTKSNDIFKLKQFKREIEESEKNSLIKQKKRSKRIIDKMYRPRTLSRYKYEEPDIEVKLSDELSRSLRSLTTEGNLLEDRFKSLQRRNIIETRTRHAFKRRYKLKKFVKKTCKLPDDN